MVCNYLLSKRSLGTIRGPFCCTNYPSYTMHGLGILLDLSLGSNRPNEKASCIDIILIVVLLEYLNFTMDIF